ncbi:MAG TPA: hypothetical protein VIR63_02630 [Pontiella sp.]
MVFSASDLNIGRLGAMKRGLPGGVFGGFGASPVLGVSGIASPRIFNLLLSVMPLEVFANTFYGLVLIVGSVSMIWYLRLWGRSWIASITGALIAFWFNSIMLAVGGHAYKMEVLALSVLSMCFIEKAIRSNSLRRTAGYSLLTGLVVGIMMIEQQDVALLAGLFIGPYTLFRLSQVHLQALSRWVAVLMPIAVVALLLSGSTVMGSYKRNIKGAAAVQERGDGSEKWNYITQWSMVPSEWPDLIAFGWSGWSSNNPEGPYWGKIGQSAEWEAERKGFRNFKLTSVYFGVIPFFLGIYGMFCAFRSRINEDARVVAFWGIAGIIGFILAFGKYSILYKLFYQLPVVSNIRAPIKFLDNFQICLGIMAAYGLDNLVTAGKDERSCKILWVAGSVCSGLLLFAGLKVVFAPAGWESLFTEMGYGNYVDVMISNMSKAWFHAAVLSMVFVGLVFLLCKGIIPAKWVVITFVFVLAVDSVMQTSRYFRASDISSLKNGNLVIEYLKENQGDERTFLLDQSGIYNQWLASDGPFHGLRFFNIWQMPRMPVEYKEYLGKVGRNQMRLWQISSIKHVLAPAQILQQLKQNPEIGKQFKPVLNYQIPTAQGMRQDVLLEYSDHIPRLALYSNWEAIPLGQHCEKMVSLEHNPTDTVLVSSESGLQSQPGIGTFTPLKGQKSRGKFSVQFDASRPSIVRFSQRYEQGWHVFVDGEESELLRLDYICMGVAVPPGKHIVEFRCASGLRQITTFLLVFMISLLTAIFFLFGKKVVDQASSA